MAEQALGLVTGALPLIEKCEIIVNKFFERKDIASNNLDQLQSLKSGYNTLQRAIESVQSSLSPMDSLIHTFINKHSHTVQDNLQTIEQLLPQVERETVVKRVRKTKQDLDKLEADAHEIKDFLCTTVLPVLRDSVRDSSKDEYTPDNNVEANPPRLTLDYRTNSTCEGQLKESVLEEDGSRVVAVVAHGQGGVGKTCALRGLADDNDIQKRFTGGTLYLQLGAGADIFAIIEGIARIVKRTGGSSLAVKLQGIKTIEAAVDEASNWFRPHTCLFLIDDIWQTNGIDSNVLYTLETMVNEQSRVVYTSRDKRFLDVCDKEITFSEKEAHGDLARRMLLTHGGFDWQVKLSARNEAAVRGILEVCHGLPLALGIAGETVWKERRVRQDLSENIWSDICDRIKSTVCHGHAERYGGVQQIVDTSLRILDSGEENGRFSRLFRALGVLEKKQKVSIGMLRKLWGIEKLKDTEDVVDQLDEVSVVRKVIFGGGKVFIQLHDVILDIAYWKAYEKGEIKNIFRRLVSNYVAEERTRRGEEANLKNKVDRSSKVEVVQGEIRKRSKVLQWFGKICCVQTSGNAKESGEWREICVKNTVESKSAICEWWMCEDDGYIHDNVCRVLQGAGYEKELLWLVSKPQWIVMRLLNGGIYAVERDLEIGKRVAESESEKDEKVVKHFTMVGRAARMSCIYVNNNNREAWFQMHGRLLWYATQCEVTKRFVEEMEECAPRPWAKASMGFLEQAGSSAAGLVPVDGEVHTVQLDQERFAFCWTSERTVGVTSFTFASGVAETQKKQYEEGIPRCFHISQDLEKVVIGFEDGAIEIWDTRTGKTKRSRGSHDESVLCVDISADGRLIVSGSFDKTVRVWEVESGELVRRPLVGHTDMVKCVAISADGKRVVSGALDNTVRVWEVETGKFVGPPLVGLMGSVDCVAMSADGERIVSGSWDMSVRVWEVGSWEPVGPPLVGHTNLVTCVALSADGMRAASVSGDRTVRVWEVGSGKLIGSPLVGHTDSVECVAISADGKRVVSGSYDESVRLWDVESEEAVGLPLVGHADEVRCVVMSADGERVVSGSDDNTVRVWEVGNGQPVGPPLVGHTDWVRSVGMSANGERVVSGSYDKTVRVWDVESGESVGPPFIGHTDQVRFVAMTADGELVVSGSGDNTVRVWKVSSGELVGPPLAHNERVSRVEVSEDGSRVVSYDEDDVGRMWCVAEGKCMLTSNDKGWKAALHALQKQSRWTKASGSEWRPSSREVKFVQRDGSKVVLGTCDHGEVGSFGEWWFSRARFAHCKVER